MPRKTLYRGFRAGSAPYSVPGYPYRALVDPYRVCLGRLIAPIGLIGLHTLPAVHCVVPIESMVAPVGLYVRGVGCLVGCPTFSESAPGTATAYLEPDVVALELCVRPRRMPTRGFDPSVVPDGVHDGLPTISMETTVGFGRPGRTL